MSVSHLPCWRPDRMGSRREPCASADPLFLDEKESETATSVQTAFNKERVGEGVSGR